MATIDIARNYSQGEILLEADLDAIRDAITTFFNTTRVNDDNLQDNSIDGSTKIIDASIVTANFTTGTISSSKITDSNVTTAKIADSAVTTAKIDDEAVTTAKILAANVTTAKLGSNSVTGAKLVNISEYSTASGTLTNGTSGAPGADITLTGLTVTVEATGRPFILTLIPTSTNTSSPSYISITTNNAAGLGSGSPGDMGIYLKLYKDSVLEDTWEFESTPAYSSSGSGIGQVSITPGSYMALQQPAAGTYVYELKLNYYQAYNATYYDSADIVVKDVKLVAVEL